MILRSGTPDVYTQTMQKAPVHAPCLGWSRFSRSRREAHTASCPIFAKVDLAFPRANFSTQIHLDLEASRIFRTTPRKKIWSHFVQSYFVRTLAYGTNFVQSYFVRTLAYGTWLRPLINALVSGLESIRAISSEHNHGIM